MNIKNNLSRQLVILSWPWNGSINSQLHELCINSEKTTYSDETDVSGYIYGLYHFYSLALFVKK